jgi:hypothetical protein
MFRTHHVPYPDFPSLKMSRNHTVCFQVLTTVEASVQIIPAPNSRLFIDDLRQANSETSCVESRTHTHLPYNIGTDEKAVIAVLPLEQVVYMRSISLAAREEGGRALANVRVFASSASGRVTAGAMDFVELPAHLLWMLL